LAWRLLIVFENVTKIYPNGTAALKGVDLSIAEAEFVFVVGASGSGKTTLLKLLLKEEEATAGRVLINGLDLAAIGHRGIPYLRRNIGIVFQDFRLLRRKTAYENVAFAMEVVGAHHRDIRRQVPWALSLVGLSGRADAYPSELSGGEQQRVALARAIINNPPILVADEPTGNLDPDTSAEIMALLGEINGIGATVVVATHERQIVDDMQMRVVEIGAGEIVRDQPNGQYSERLGGRGGEQPSGRGGERQGEPGGWRGGADAQGGAQYGARGGALDGGDDARGGGAYGDTRDGGWNDGLGGGWDEQ
jgi:cell division transport system ATP-binding protein